tara:strand:- start:603 stop:785 length:183 start_codon:yes stop_codon:yes gene_type:complete
MDYGSGYLIGLVLWFVGALIHSYLTEKDEWEAHPVTSPQVTSRHGDDDSFYWALMLNQRE